MQERYRADLKSVFRKTHDLVSPFGIANLEENSAKILKNDVSETVLIIFESKYSSQFEIELENCLIRPKQKSRDFSIFLKRQFYQFQC